MKPAASVFLLIEDIYKAVGDGSRWTAVLRSFQQVLGSSACAIGRFDFERRVGSLEWVVGIDPQRQAAYGHRLAASNPWLAREECFRCEGAIWSGRELAEHRLVVSGEFYQDWLKPQDLFHASFAVLRWSGSETVYLMALRSPAAGPFERRDLEACSVYLPHLRQAVALAERLGSLSPAAQRPLDQLVGQAPGPLMVLDSEERPIAASRDAEALFGGGKPFRKGRYGLHLAHDRDREAFDEQMNTAIEVAQGASLSLGGSIALRSGRGTVLNASVVPLPAGALPGQDRPAVAVLADPRLPDEESLREVYGLTAAEARLALRIVRGQSIQEAADRLKIAVTTARTHLQRVYGKTRTRRQSELVALLLGAGEPSAD